tara:strand:- start:92 stop:823 length:732 start_codon:yes stop_codon:yes gene_type:complete
MFSFLKDKIYTALAKKNPIYKSSMEAGQKALLLCPNIQMLIENKSKAHLKNFEETFNAINQAIKSNNKYALRETFCEVSIQLAIFMVLKPVEEISFYKNVKIHKNLIGGLDKKLVEVGSADKTIRKMIYGIQNSPDEPDHHYMKTFVDVRYEFTLVCFEILNAARIQLGDCNINIKRDWALPLLYSYCLNFECDFYRSLGKKHKNIDELAPYVIFPQLILNGEDDPLFSWIEKFPNKKDLLII